MTEAEQHKHFKQLCDGIGWENFTVEGLYPDIVQRFPQE